MVALYVRLLFLLLCPELRLWHIDPNVVRLNQLKQGQNNTSIVWYASC
jgi:hypothetical protein